MTVYYDLNGDGVADGNKTVLLGYGTEGVVFDPTHRTVHVDRVDGLSPETNALDDAFIRLLDYINFDTTTGPVPCTGAERAGSACNPVDVELSPDILIRISSVTEVPYMWGPIEMGVVTWITQGD